MLWYVVVREKQNTTIKIEVNSFHPDAGAPPDNPVFLMQLLIQTAYTLDDDSNWIPSSPLGKMFQKDQTDDVSFFKNHYKNYIQSYRICSARDLAEGEEVDPDDPYDYEEEWEVVYELTITDSKWIEHLSKDESFESAAWSEGPYIDETIDAKC